EVYRQLGYAPDYVFIPTGDGVILSGIYKGFRDLKQFGLVEKIPRMVAVQSEGSPNLYNAMESGGFSDHTPSKTLADSISVDVPSCGYLAMQCLREYDGICMKVSDESILNAQFELSSTAGLFCEPASAAAYAGFLTAKDEFNIDINTTVVLMITGNGLKDIEAASEIIPKLPSPVNSLEDIEI
ncbi:MAG: threonine synthase, partial [bacterium]